MQKLNFGRRLFSAILSVILILGAVLAVPVSADEADGLGYTLSTLTHREVAARHSNNELLSTATYRDIRNLSGSYIFTWRYSLDSATSKGRMIDGNTSDYNFGDGKTANNIERTAGSGAALQTSTEDETNAVRLVFDMGSSKLMSSFLISWAEIAPVKSYKIYVSSNTAWSYSSNMQLVADVTGETTASCNRLITLDTAVTARTVVFEFTAAGFTKGATDPYTSDTFNGIVLTELGVYGYISDVTNEKVLEMSSDNLLAQGTGSVASGTLYYKESTTAQYLRDIGYLTNGETGDTSFKHTEDGDAVIFGTSSADTPVKITYDLAKSMEIAKLLLSWTSDSPAAAYNIYLSDSSDGLYSEDNCIVAKTNEPAVTFNRLITLDTAKTGRYIGFEFTGLTDMSTPDAYCVALMELGAYGYISDITNSEIKAISESNMLADGVFYNTTGKYYYDSGTKDYLRNASYLTNGLAGRTGYTHSTDEDGIIFGASGDLIQISYDLLGTKKIEKVLLSWTTDAPATAYNVYIGDTMEGLYDEANLVVAKTNEPSSTFNRLITLDEVQSGHYIGFEFTSLTYKSTPGANCVVLMELGAYEPLSSEAYTVNVDYIENSGAAAQIVENGVCIIEPSEKGISALAVNGTEKSYSIYVSTDEDTLFDGDPTFTCTALQLTVFSQSVVFEYIGIKGEGLTDVSVWSDFEIVNGDLTGDLTVNAQDLIAVRKELLAPSDLDFRIKNVNNDEFFDVRDLVNLKKKV